jgi:hypothetical protein
VLTLKVPGYRLDVDGALAEAMGPGPDPGAWVVLTGEVRGCRLFQDRHYLLRLAGLVRILDP